MDWIVSGDGFVFITLSFAIFYYVLCLVLLPQ